MTSDSLLTSIVAGGCTNVFDCAVKSIWSKQKLKEIFSNAGEFIRTFEIDESELKECLAYVFSDENMKRLSNEAKDCSGYTFKEKLLSQLKAAMLQRSMTQTEADFYAKRFFALVIGEIAEIAPTEYDRYYLSEWKSSQELALAEIIKRVTDIQNALNSYKDHGIEIDSADSLDRELHRRSKIPGIGIHSFETDDDEFRKEFREKKEDNIVYIRARNREEAIYSIIAELWRSNDSRPIFVVRNKKSWENLRSIAASNAVYIPWFYDSEIPAIENGTNIFIYTDGLPSFSNDEIELRPRMLNTIIQSLKHAGMEDMEAGKLVAETHGLYSQMKKKTERTLRMDRPAWVVELPDIIKKTCLLLGQWTDAEGDKAVVEQLSKIKYELFMEKINTFCDCEDPLVHVVGYGRKKSYYLSSVENVWGYVYVSSEEPIWREFTSLFLDVLNESEKLFTYRGDEGILAQSRGEQLFWSANIRNGMTRTMIMKACYDKEESCQYSLDNLVMDILNHIDTEEKWRYISGFFADLCEISPKVTMKRLQDELKTGTGLLGLFSNQDNRLLVGKNHYIDILFGVEELLVQKEYAVLGFEWMLKLDSLSYDYSSNSPKDSIMKVLCPWHNVSALQSIEEKKTAAEIALRIDENAWGYLYKFISRNDYCAIGGIHSPKYRQYERNCSVSGEQYAETITAYFRLLIGYIGGDYRKWSDIITVLYAFPVEQQQYALATFDEEVKKISDIDKALLKLSIRQLIYKHRYFSTATWAMGEENIKKYEKLLDQIEVDTREYEYVYFFDSTREAVFLTPVTFEEEDRREVNQESASKVIREKVCEFAEKGLDIRKLASICALTKNSTLGMSFAVYSNPVIFNDTIFEALYCSQENKIMALDYVNGMYRKGIDVFCSINSLKEKLVYSADFLVSVYRIDAAFSKGIPRISDAPEEIKQKFWKNVGFQNESNYEWALNECRQYGNTASYINLLYQAFRDETYTMEELYDRLLPISSVKVDPDARSNGYDLSEVMKPLQEKFFNDAEKSEKLSQIEIQNFHLLGWENMRCFKENLKHSPNLYAEMASIIFRKDETITLSEVTEDDQLRAKVIYRLFDMAKFCPAERDGVIDEGELIEWVKQFKELLVANKQTSLFGFLLGRLWCYSPVGIDGHSPCEAVRRVIEDTADDDMLKEYAISVFNNRGVFTVTGGRSEQALADKYKKEADYLSVKYPKTASVFYQLSESYAEDAKRERRRAEDGTF